MALTLEHAKTFGVAATCRALGVSRASFYRWKNRKALAPSSPKKSARALSYEENKLVLDTLNEDRFVDLPPAQVVASLLDQGTYLCSERTMYRILAEHDQLRERRAFTRHKNHPKPELLASGPNQLWSWDITKLKGPSKWTYFYLYVILDVFSRYVVGWMIATKECSLLAEKLMEETCKRQKIDRGKLTLHADRGSVMTSKSFAFLLADLGVTKTHSRPYVSNDNPYSESQFKTMKYRPNYPDRFGSMEDARGFCRGFFHWYNEQHHHSGLSMMTPEQVHLGQQNAIKQARDQVLSSAFQKHPRRFVKGLPSSKECPRLVWINPPLGLSS